MIKKPQSSNSDYKKIIIEKIEKSQIPELKKKKDFLLNFNIEYFEDYEESEILNDIKIFENLLKNNEKISINILFPENEDVDLKIYINNQIGEKVLISDLISTIESFFVKIVNIDHYENHDKENGLIIYSFQIQGINKDSIIKNDKEKQKNFFEVFNWIFNQSLKTSISSSLSLKSGLELRNVKLLDAIFSYLKQIYGVFDSIFAKNLVNQNEEIFLLMLDFFNERLHPKKNNLTKISALRDKILSKINSVKNLNEFNLLKKLFEVFGAISRTNFFQNKEWISFKVKSILIPGIKNEGVFAEIFVFHDYIEGVHLRGGKISRGGFRWSDRQDYRTEVFDLMKAQIKKNSIITPTGAKACFLIKNFEENKSNKDYAVDAYKIFVKGLLDITDNLDSSGALIRPSHVVIPKDLPKAILAQEEKDYYIVAAADKGTARFSDFANQVSKEYNFWLGDAFASGGSNGYDHKGLAITSRGMWVSAKKLFSEINKDIEKETISVVGIGDMAGDVFGNGMLLSRKIKLIGAFNHVHIFLDPNPDEETSYEERKRLFNMPGSTWKDYNQSLISDDGGIFERSAKTIKIGLKAAKALGISQISNLEFTPDELIQHILKAKVDLLFNGGIGTFVKSSLESNEDAADRFNDSIRVNGKDLRVFVVAEGGNLGFTQKGRVEFARNGGRTLGNSSAQDKKIAKINTDFIDNSAGVSCSDREVNIKIALESAVRNGKISLEDRNVLLKQMENEVCELVLKDNLLQNNALMIEENRGKKNISWHVYLIRKLEKLRILNPEFESLPSDDELLKLCEFGEALSRPELCILLSYSKIWLKNEILSSKIPENPYFDKFLIGYFPVKMQENFRNEILAHPLRNEIITNYIVNTIINRIGINFILNLMEKSGTTIKDIVNAYFIIRDSYGLRKVWHSFEYDYEFPNNTSKILAFIEIRKYTSYIISRFLRVPGYNLSDLSKNIKELGEKISYSIENFETLVSKKSLQYYQKKCNEYKKYISEEACFTLLAKISGLIFIPSIIHIARKKDVDFDLLVNLYFLIEDKLDSRVLRKHISKFLISGGLYQEVSIAILLDDIAAEHSEIVEFIIEKYSGNFEEKICSEELIALWFKDFTQLIENYSKIRAKNLEIKEFDYSFLILLLNRIKLLHD